MDLWTDGWTYGRTDGWTDGRTDRWTQPLTEMDTRLKKVSPFLEAFSHEKNWEVFEDIFRCALVFLSVRLPVRLSIRMSVRLSIHPSVRPSVRPYVHYHFRKTVKHREKKLEIIVVVY